MTLCGVIIFFLLQKRERAQFILAIIFGFLLCACIEAYSEVNNIVGLSMIAFPFTDVIGYTIGVLIYMYIMAIYSDHVHLNGRRYLLLMPTILCLTFLTIPRWIVFYGSDNIQSQRLTNYEQFVSGHSIILYVQAIFLIVCCVLSIRRLGYYQRKLKHQYSNLTDIDIIWIRNICLLLISLLSLLLIMVYFDIGSQHIGIENDLLTTLFLVAIIVYLGYAGTAQSHILLPTNSSIDHDIGDAKVDHKKTHHLVGATEDELSMLKQRLTESMEEDRLYLESNLSLAELAAHIGTTDKKLSALLNHYIDASFYDYINDYRIALVKSRLIDDQYNKYSILGIAMDSGFNSKASFNRIFKQVTGMSPSQYKSSKRR